jgi:hypothetical protein
VTGWKQQPDVVPGRAIAAVIAAAMVATAVGVAIAWGLADCGRGAGSGVAEPGAPDRAPARPARMPSEVSAVETTLFDERAQGLEDRAAAEAWLSSYGWVDRERGIVHIPIDAAIDLYLRRRAASGEAPP